MPTWLAIVLGVFVLLVVVLAVGGVLGAPAPARAHPRPLRRAPRGGQPRPRRRARRGPRLGARGAGGRRARPPTRPQRGAAPDELTLVQIVDRPGTDDDKAVFRGRRTSGSRSAGRAATGCSRTCASRAARGPDRRHGLGFPACSSSPRSSSGRSTLANRVVSTSHQTGLVHDHLPTDDLRAYHEARAARRRRRDLPRGDRGRPDRAADLAHARRLPAGDRRRLRGGSPTPCTRTARGCSSSSSTAAASRSRPRRARPAVAPSAVPSPRFKSEPRALTARRAGASWSTATRTAARHCREGGIDGIEVSMSHGYLIAQFFSPALEPARRTATGRRRAAALRRGGARRGARRPPGRSWRSACGWPPTSSRPRGSTPPRARRSPARCARPGLVDFASFALGHSAYVAASTWIAPPPPTPGGGDRRAARARARRPVDVPVIGTTRVVDVAAAERLVGAGAADAVGMTRALIADPDLVAKAARRPDRTTCSPASAATRAASATTTPACRSAASSTRAPAASGRCRGGPARTGG